MIDQQVFQDKKAAYYTLGCKLNFAETSTLGKMLAEQGVRKVRPGERADICLINTCSVTELADKKCRQAIRRIGKEHPGAFIVVTGCYAQLKPEEVAHIDGVDLVTKDAFILFERSEFISAMVICSEISQLVSVANRKSILDQFPIKIWMGGTGMMTIRYFSKKAGKYPESDPSKRSQNDLLPADALLELPDDICLICQEGSLGELCEKDHISFT